MTKTEFINFTNVIINPYYINRHIIVTKEEKKIEVPITNYLHLIVQRYGLINELR